VKKIALYLLFICATAYSQNAEFDHSLEFTNNFFLEFEGKSTSLEYLLGEYIHFPSVSGNELEAGEFIKSVCKKNGLHITDFGNENGKYNFAASVFPLSSNKPNIILLNHIDVIPESNTSNNRAYSGKIIGNKVFGRGAIDNKGAALMQLSAMVQYLNNEDLKNNKYNITFLAVSCEETQCAGGINYVLDEFLEILNPVVVIGEGPSELTSILGGSFENPIFGISISQKRPLWLELELKSNTNGHGSITPLKYANKDMVAALNKLTKKKNKAIYNDLNVSFLKNLAAQKKGFEKIILKNPKLFKPILTPKLRKHPEMFSLFSNTITLTNIQTNSTSFNKISSKTTAYLDCRLLPRTDEGEFLKEIKKRLGNDQIKITIVAHSNKNDPSSIENMYYKNLEEAISRKYTDATIIPLFLPNVSDLKAFRRNNISAYATIPVYLSRKQVEAVHNKNENISIESLYDGAEVYYNFIRIMENSQVIE
jgi:acetylornithine deacetylase/succinyl-diaminopimelate desuccinylase-like protein